MTNWKLSSWLCLVYKWGLSVFRVPPQQMILTLSSSLYRDEYNLLSCCFVRCPEAKSAGWRSVLHTSAQSEGDGCYWLVDIRSTLLSWATWLKLTKKKKKKLTQVQVFHGVLAQCSRFSFEWSQVLSHVCGHIKKSCQEKRQNKQGKPINECWNLCTYFVPCLIFCHQYLSVKI